MIISLIAALSDNYVIGRNRGMPWHMPADLKYFFQTTRNHHVIMGRKTFNEFGVSKPLPHRTNLVISRQKDLKIPGAYVFHSLDDALEFARKNGETETFIIGGGEIYRQALPLADRMYLTFIHTIIPDGDTFFPSFDKNEWVLVKEKFLKADAENPFDLTFRVYHRKSR